MSFFGNMQVALEFDFQKLDKVAILESISTELLRGFDQINETTSFEKLHKLRIKFKKFRYALEIYLNLMNLKIKDAKHVLFALVGNKDV